MVGNGAGTGAGSGQRGRYRSGLGRGGGGVGPGPPALIGGRNVQIRAGSKTDRGEGQEPRHRHSGSTGVRGNPGSELEVSRAHGHRVQTDRDRRTHACASLYTAVGTLAHGLALCAHTQHPHTPHTPQTHPHTPQTHPHAPPDPRALPCTRTHTLAHSLTHSHIDTHLPARTHGHAHTQTTRTPSIVPAPPPIPDRLPLPLVRPPPCPCPHGVGISSMRDDPVRSGRAGEVPG